MYRYQEKFNNGFSYINTVGQIGSGSPNVQDTDEETQKNYKEYLEYLVCDKNNKSRFYMSDLPMNLEKYKNWRFSAIFCKRNTLRFK